MQTRTWIPSGDLLTAAKWEGGSRHCWEKTVLVLLCGTTRSSLNCYSWCGFPFRCLENDSADHIHILKYFLRTCNQTAGTDSFLQRPATTQSFQRGSSRRQKHQGFRIQAEICLDFHGRRGKPQGQENKDWVQEIKIRSWRKVWATKSL